MSAINPEDLPGRRVFRPERILEVVMYGVRL
jgi:hypothetical protein